MTPNHPEYLTEEQRLSTYGRCPECDGINIGEDWCRSCNANHFRQAFSTWTSENTEINYFIRNVQIHTWDYISILEWYPWGAFSEIEKIGEGAYGTVFRAKNKLGRIRWWDHQNNQWHRLNEGKHVALKTIGHSKLLSEDFLNEVINIVLLITHFVIKVIYFWYFVGKVTTTMGLSIDLFWITRNSTTGQYLLVLFYFESGDLRKRLQNQATNWKGNIAMIYLIAKDMKSIHEAGMIHR